MTGAGASGYAALQITEVTGQLHADRKTSDLYFATQDNDIRASPDGGSTWPANRCCEGFFLNIWREPLAPADTRLTGVSCAGCGNFISGPLLAGQAGFPDPPNNAGNPRLLKPACYVSNTAISGLSASVFDLTMDTGGSWTPRYGFAEPVRDLSKAGGPVADPVVYVAVKLPGATPDGNEIVGIKRIAGVLGSGSPLRQARTPGAFGGDKQLLSLLGEGTVVKGLYLDGRKLRGFILASRDVAPEQLPRKVPIGPHVAVEIQRPRERTAPNRVAAVMLRGTGFDPRRPIAVSVDGKPVKLEAPPRFTAKGEFSIPLPPTVGLGGHTVLVEQRGEGKVIRDATTFVITPEDFPKPGR